MQRGFILAGIVAGTLVAGAAAAQEPVSHYTSVAEKTCRKDASVKVAGAEHAARWICQGRGGYVVVVSEDDLRTSVTIGRSPREALKEPAATQTFAPFNSIGERIEWRSASDRLPPYAAIQRWTLSPAEQPKASLLVVLRLPPGPVCHVAYIDGAANPDANELARRAADEFSRGFKCGTDKVHIVGKEGAATAIAKD